MWYFDKCRHRRACAASFYAKRRQMMIGQWTKSHRIFKRLAKALIRLCVCVYSFEPLLVAHTTGASPEFIVCHKVISLTLVYFSILSEMAYYKLDWPLWYIPHFWKSHLVAHLVIQNTILGKKNSIFA